MDNSQHTPRTVIARGPRELEERLLEDIETLIADRAPGDLSSRIQLIVPSRSLRLHLLAAIARRQGRAILGLTCQTHFSFALEVLNRAQSEASLGGDLVPLLAERLSRKQRALKSPLGRLVNGFGTVTGAVRDLLDAGLQPDHLEGLVEQLAEERTRHSGASEEIDRAEAVIKVTAQIYDILDLLKIATKSSLLQSATDEARSTEPNLPPCSALLIYGYADATGVATDFLQALHKHYQGTLYLDHPPDPAEPERTDAGVAFTYRLAERLEAGDAETDSRDQAGFDRPIIETHEAIGADGEVREIAGKLRTLLDTGTEAERIGIVTRSLAPYRRPIRIHFTNLGIPFSGIGQTGGKRGGARPVGALLDLLKRQKDVSVDRWLDSLATCLADTPVFDLRSALFAMGAGRLHEIPGIPLESHLSEGQFALPSRHGFDQRDEESLEPTASSGHGAVRRRQVSGEAIETIIRRASGLVERLNVWSDIEFLEDHRAQFDELLFTDLEWNRDDPLAIETVSAEAASCSGLPIELDLSLDEYIRLIEARLNTVGEIPIGGTGGGVQVLDVTEARARTFDHLFLLGLNSGIFPRNVQDDPILPDRIRSPLSAGRTGLLPDLPQKQRGHDEERYLFAQLLAASPHVYLSWQTADSENKALGVSPLVERLRCRADGEVLGSVEEKTPTSPLRTGSEHAIQLALTGPRAALGKALPLTVTTAIDSLELDGTVKDLLPSARQLATYRIALLDELDPERGTAAGESIRSRLGPFYGYVGPPRAGNDPRQSSRIPVTTLENLATCPWRTFLERVLRLETAPDPLDRLPALSPVLIGSLAHRILEEICRVGTVGSQATLVEVMQHEPASPAWPGPDALRKMTQRASKDLCRREGIGLPGFPALLARVVGPYLEVARRLDWEGTTPAILGVEMTGEVPGEGSDEPPTIFFRADRVDRVESGLLLTDYKSGKKSLIEGKKTATVHKNLLQGIATGRMLQAATYAVASSGRGRYLVLQPDLDEPDEKRATIADLDEPGIADAFRFATSRLLAVWREGTFFPRVEEVSAGREPSACGYCAVAEACLRHDSGAKSRIRDWAQALPDDERRSAADQTLAAVWNLKVDAKKFPASKEVKP